MLLGTEENLCVLPYEDFRSNAAKQARDTALALGKVVVKEKDMDGVLDTVNRIKAALHAKGVDLIGATECAAPWTYMSDEGPVQCRLKVDHCIVDKTNGFVWIDDFKSCDDANPQKVIRSCIDYGYDIQRYSYVKAFETLMPEYAGRIKFRHWFIETSEPYMIVPVELDAMFMSLGQMKWDYAANLWAKCLKENSWPSWEDKVQQLSPPKWELMRWAERGTPKDAPIPF